MNEKIKKMNVGSWNIYNGLPYGFSILYDTKRLNKVIENIIDSNLDILALQEVNNIALIKLLEKKCGEKYHFFYNEKNNLYLQQIILGLFLFIIYFLAKDTIIICVCFLFINFVFKNSTLYNFFMGEVSGGLVFLINKEIFNIDNIEKIYKEFNCQDGDFLNFFNKRGYCKLKIKDNENEILIYNTHLNCIKNKCQYRKNQIIEIEEDIKKHDNVILLGDLNTIKDYNEIDYEKYKLIDTNKDNKLFTWDSNNYLTNTLLSQPVNQKVDYIIVKNLEFEKSEIMFNKKDIASDHYGIKCVILNKKRKEKKLISKKIEKNKNL